MIKISFLKYLGISSLVTFALGSTVSAQTIAMYGDPTFSRVVSIDVENMNQLDDVFTRATPYPVDRAGDLDKVYAITRGAPSVDIVDPRTLSNLGSIELEHRPRSGEAYNRRLNLVLIAGGNKPMSSVIDPTTDSVVATAGLNELTTPEGFGGSLSSGHPIWISNRRFAVIDRANRKIQLYRLIGNRSKGFRTRLLDEIDTPSSVHHILRAKNRRFDSFYAVLEGAPNEGLRPGLMELFVYRNKFFNFRTVSLRGFPVETMGSHHADLHPNGVHIYVGSTEGHMFVVNRYSMRVVRVINTGRGSGHTRFIPQRNLAVVTNHRDTFVTLINTRRHRKIKNIDVSPEEENGQILQSHTNHVTEDATAYYAFASDSGVFFEIDLDDRRVSRTLDTQGTPLQGVFLNLDPAN